MKRLALKNSLLLLILLFSACGPDECLDIEALNQLTATAKQWYVKNDLGNRTLIDSNGITQTLITGNSYEHVVDDAVEDDCGNNYGSFDYSVSFLPSLSYVNFSVDISGSGISEDEFYLLLGVNRNGSHKEARYDFASQSAHDNRAVINILNEHEVLNHTYQNVMEFIFPPTTQQGEIIKVYYARQYGIIEFTDISGVTYQVEYESLNFNN